MAHTGLTVAGSTGYIDHVFTEDKLEAGVKIFYGRAARVDPGCYCGIDLSLLAEGCESGDRVDRFYSNRNDCGEFMTSRLAGI